ncbi:response regulator [Methylobacterium sp. R2-1]|uniref:response regulator n=1 Tax=Methylobacterium sp. R2-1 TaxID=2587064 RepID=UPI0016180F62|nr:response regulator [Methylobacterium sp. R2-1]MBB2964307.1 CheY-like chemotaxis protein [Methylobacterium sp. R2-1]
MSVLEGRRVLLVEDESMVAMLAEDMLLDLGCDVVVAMRLDQALAQVEAGDFDLAVLDVNMGSTRSYPVADALFERCVPFLFATGYGLEGVEPDYRVVPVLQKPYQHAQMRRLLEHLLTCEDLPRKGGSNGGGFNCGCVGGHADKGGGGYRADAAR